MKRFIILILGLVAFEFELNAQDKNISWGIGYVFFGEGDNPGFNFQNSLQFPLFNDLDLKVGIQIANAARTRDETVYDRLDRHNVFNFANYLNLAITPIKNRLFSLSLSAGGIWRYRSEIYTRSITWVRLADDSRIPIYGKDYRESFDVGYNVNITALIRISERLYTGGSGQFIGYNMGSGLYSINFVLNFRL